MKLDSNHIRAALDADYAIQSAIQQARYGEKIMQKVLNDAKRMDTRQLHRQHCQPEGFTDWRGLRIALFIVGVIAVIAIGSTIDFKGL